MLKLFLKIKRNKIFFAFVFLLLLLLPSTIYLQDENSRREIVTALGIDLVPEGVELTVVKVTRKEESIKGTGLNIDSAKGETVTEAIFNMSINSGKEIGFAHCEAIVLSDKVLQENAFKYLDFFVRTRLLTTSAEVINIENAKEGLQLILESQKLSSLSIREIVQANSEILMAKKTDLDSFCRQFYSNTSISVMPRLVIEEESKEDGGGGESGGGESSSGGSGNSESANTEVNTGTSTNEKQSGGSEGGSEGGGGESGGGESGGGESSSGGSGSKKKVVDKGDVVIVKNGKRVETLNLDQSVILSLLDPSITTSTFKLKNLTTNHTTDATFMIKGVEKKMFRTTKMVGNKPLVYYNIFIVVELLELAADNYTLEMVNDLVTLINLQVQDRLVEEITQKLSDIVNLAKENGWDLFDVYRNFYAKEPDNWLRYLDSLDDSQNYMEQVMFCCDLSFMRRV